MCIALLTVESMRLPCKEIINSCISPSVNEILRGNADIDWSKEKILILINGTEKERERENKR